MAVVRVTAAMSVFLCVIAYFTVTENCGHYTAGSTICYVATYCPVVLFCAGMFYQWSTRAILLSSISTEPVGFRLQYWKKTCKICDFARNGAILQKRRCSSAAESKRRRQPKAVRAAGKNSARRRANRNCQKPPLP